MTCNVCGDRDLACPKCQPENWASRWRAQRLRAYWEAVDALKLELDRQRGLAKSDKGNGEKKSDQFDGWAGPHLCCVLTEDNGSFCGKELPCPDHSDGDPHA